MATATDTVAPIDPMEHQGLVWSIARRYQGRGLDLEDLVQSGQFGLLRAIELFDPALGNQFSTYATYWIRQAISRATKETGRTIRIPEHIIGMLAGGITPESDGLTDRQREGLRAADQIVGGGLVRHSSFEEGSFDGIVPDHRAAPSPELADIPQYLGFLSAREQEILRLHFGLDGPEMTFDEIGRQMGLSGVRIGQLAARAIASLRRRFADPVARAADCVRREHEDLPVPDNNGLMATIRITPEMIEPDDPEAPNGRCPECGKAYGKYRRCFACRPTDPVRPRPAETRAVRDVPATSAPLLPEPPAPAIEPLPRQPARPRGRPPATKFFGVTPDGADPEKPYRAVLGLGGKKTRWLGRFATAREAALAWDDAAFAEFGAETRLNFPDRRPEASAARVADEMDMSSSASPELLRSAPDKPWQRQVRAVYSMCEILDTLDPKEREWVVIQACQMFGFAFDVWITEESAAFGRDGSKGESG